MKKVWYIFSEDHHLGPFEVREIVQKFKEEEVSRKALLWKEGMKDWVTLEKIPDFKGFLVDEEEAPPELPNLPELPGSTPISESEANSDDISNVLPPDIPDLPDVPEISSPEENLIPEMPLPSVEVEKLVEEEEASPAIDRKLQRKINRIRDQKKWRVDYFKNIEKEDESLVSDYKKAHKVPASVMALLAFFCVVFISLFIFVSFDFSTSEPGFEDLYVRDIQRLGSIASSINQEKPLVGLALEKNGKGLWLALNYAEPYSLLLRFESVSKKILSSERVVFSASCTVVEHWCDIKNLNIEEGTNIFPGFYNVKVKGFHLPEKEPIQKRLIYFLKTGGAKNEKLRSFTFEGSAFLFKGPPSQFNRKLKERERKYLEENAQFLREKLEEYRTLKALVSRMMEIYTEVLKKIRVGRKISRFEGKYAVTVGPLLRSLILNNKDQYDKERLKNSFRAKYNQNVFSYGRQIGNLASDMVVLTSKRKRLGPKTKVKLENLFKNKVDQLLSKGSRYVKEIESLLQI